MSNHLSNPIFLHPLLYSALPGILAEIKKNLPAGWNTGVDSKGIHRTPLEQFEIYKEGRKFNSKTGQWEKVGTTYTPKDGYRNLSRHNYLGAQAVDIILYKPDGSILKAGLQEKKIELGALLFGFTWGGNFTNEDLPHIEIPKERLFKSSFVKDEALQWQRYLYKAGALKKPEDLDGIWGNISAQALKKVTGSNLRTPDAWEKLFTDYGPLGEFTDYQELPFLPIPKAIPV